MGIIRTEVIISNPSRKDLQPVTVNALVNTGAVHVCLQEHIMIQMGLSEKREVTLAIGQKASVLYCGPVELTFKSRHCFTGAMIFGDEPLLGAIPMADMDLVVIPGRQIVDVNPDSPNIPSSFAK